MQKPYAFGFLLLKNVNAKGGKKIEPNSKPKSKSILKCSISKIFKESNQKNRKKFLKAWIPIPFFGILFNPLNLVNPEPLNEKLGKPFLTKTGLKIVDFAPGQGAPPNWGELLVIHYVLYFFSEEKLEKIDSTYDRRTPFLFLHGGGQIIPGLEEAVHDMKLGGRRRVILPNNLGYLTPGLGPIPPYSEGRKKIEEKINKQFQFQEKNLMFDIEILSIQERNNSSGLFSSFLLNSSNIKKILN